MMNIYKLIPLFFISFIFSQFVDMQISIEYNKLDQDYHIKKQIIEDLDEDIKKYFLLNKFCQEYDFIQLNLKIHLIIESINSIQTSTGTTNSIKSHILITNNTDQYYFSKGVNFEYSKNTTLVYNPYKYTGFESILNYYAFLFIGYELDTWGNNLGTSYFNKAFEVSSEAEKNSNWKTRKDEIKLILENLELRKARFLYFTYYDIIHSEDYKINPKNFDAEIQSIMNDLYNELLNVYLKIGYDKNTLKFIDYLSDELPQLFHKYNMNEAIEFLILFDRDNENKYSKYLN